MHTPFAHALCAALYISGVVFVMQYISRTIGPSESLLLPMAMLSLFVLSAAVMGYLFLLRPLELYLEGRKREAVSFFAWTVGLFACFTFWLLSIVLYAGIKGFL